MKRTITLLASITLTLSTLSAGKQPPPPRLALFFVIDQLSSHMFNKVKKHFKYGFRTLLEKSVVYHHAYHQHAKPTTAVGHTALSTGTLACDHGIVANDWYTPKGTHVQCDDDTSQSATLLSENGGKSAHFIRVDGLSDQLAFANTPTRINKSLSLSLKSRSSIPLASKMGKAVWLNQDKGLFTSSKAYFEKLPSWVTSFNKEKLQRLTSFTWNKARNEKDAYAFFLTKGNPARAIPEQIVGKAFQTMQDGKRSFNAFVKAPIGNQFVLDLARKCIKSEYSKDGDGTLTVWISLSTPDLLGHLTGPESIAYIDTLYHIDRQLGDFLTFIEKKMNISNPLIALTSDHGIMPIPEVAQEKGYSAAQRISAKKIIEDMNSIGETFGIEKVVIGYVAPHFYLNETGVARLTSEKKSKLLTELKKTLTNTHGIKTVWTYDELKALNVERDSIEYAFQKQLYPGRSGHLICYTEPYVQLTNYPTGTSHASPYHYDTQVPLFVYRKGQVEKKDVYAKVWIPQLPVTLAHLLQVDRPSASMYEMLPGVA